MRETQNVVDTVFGGMAEDINDFSKTALKEFGLSELAAKKFTSTMGAMLKSSGISGQAVRDMSIDLAGLTADMASFYNLGEEEMFRKIMSGMSGMTMPLKELGINMNIANLENYAMTQGIQKSWQEMNQAEQTMIRYNYLLSVTGDAQGDFARESGTLANQIKILKEQWQEFMGLIGRALYEIILPVVKFLNKTLEILIKITKQIGKIYTMITGRELGASAEVADVNAGIEDSALGAADGEGKLADGIGKAAKAAKKALAPFDELNILQQNLGTGGSGAGTGGGIGDLFTPSKSEINTTIETKQIDDGLEETKRKADSFFIWLGDKWNGLKQMLAVSITVPAPIFAAIPSPIYEPNWNLTPPLIPSPVFQPIPNPVYNPNWNLDYPVLQPLTIPALELGQYNSSLENMKKGFEGAKTRLEGLQAELSKKISEETARVSKNIENGLSTAWGTIERNYNAHKEKVGQIATGISTVLVANLNQGLSKVGTNVNNTIVTVQTNLQTFGSNVGSIAAETAKSFANNLSEGFKTTSQNIATFASSAGESLKAFGRGALSIAAETARGFASNFINGLSTAWNKFKEFAAATGEKVSGWFNANKSVITTTAIVAGVAVGAGALALAAPALIPYAATALGGLSAIPALAKGGITNGEMIARIGDNPGGREVVSPLDGLLDMIIEAVSTTNNSSGNINLVVKIGEDTIGERAVDYINDKTIMTGESPILI